MIKHESCVALDVNERHNGHKVKFSNETTLD